MTKERIIIVGGLSAGPSAAAKARRTNEECEILLFEKTANISYATCGIPYALSGRIKDRDKLMVVKADLLRKRFNIDVHLNEPVHKIDTKKKTIVTNKGEYEYTKLVFATGGTSVTPPIEGLAEYEKWSHCKTIENYDKIVADGVLEDKKNFTVVGAGLIGIEVAENLQRAGKNVTVVELAPYVLPIYDEKFATLAGKVLEDNGIDVRTGVSLQKIDAENNQLHLSDGSVLDTDYMLMGVGVKPNTELLLKEGAEHLKNGAIIVNEKMETSIPDVYAAGDCASITNRITGQSDFFPMGTHSNKCGRAAGANAAGGNEQFGGAYGTAIVKVFDYTLARTGMNPRRLEKEGIPYQSTLVIVGATPGFYGTPKDLIVEIYYHAETKVLLGAEVFGEKGVDKRIDVLSACIYAKLTIDDLPNLDLAYAPPFSPAKDAVIVAGYVAQNSSKGDFDEINSLELKQYLAETVDEFQLVDVRNPVELQKQGKIKGAINLPLDGMRDQLDQLDKAKETIVYCAKGLRGYLATMILLHNGFTNVSNLSGGFTAWNKIVGEVEMPVEELV
ncbi:FAD-dependent oxidoreductase [Flammeovirgaceae bacterium SG7u.111]|nr:FAD-dependent oxidoreductase [Flammeovirgaceae bacterium SG7u.132]WPO34429.1 FAD-dependent oxidoreductase [Flammeovirgaceae bacterium SG7u.111]